MWVGDFFKHNLRDHSRCPRHILASGNKMSQDGKKKTGKINNLDHNHPHSHDKAVSLLACQKALLFVLAFRWSSHVV